MHRSEFSLQIFPRAQKAKHAFLGFFSAVELLDHARLLDESFIADRNRNEEEIVPAIFKEGIDVPTEHAQPWSQRLAGSRAAPFDEEFLGKAFAHEVSDVGTEDFLVERILEGLSEIEGAHLPKQESERPESHIVPRRDMRRHEIVLIEEPREDQEVEIGAMTRDEHDRVFLCVLGNLGQAMDFDRNEELLEEPSHGGRHEAHPIRTHIGGALAKDLFDLALRLFGRTILGARPHLHGRTDPRILQHFAEHSPTRLERRAFDASFFAKEIDQDRTADLSCDTLPALLGRGLREGSDIDFLAHADRETSIGKEEASDLGEIRRSRDRAIVDIQEAVFGARPLSPENGQRHDEDFASVVALPNRTHHFPDQVEFIGSLATLAAAEKALEALGPEKKEEAPPRVHLGGHGRAVFGVFDLARTAPAQSEHDRQDRGQGPVVVEVNRVRKTRQTQPMSKEERIEKEVVETARITHHVDDAAARFERLRRATTASSSAKCRKKRFAKKRKMKLKRSAIAEGASSVCPWDSGSDIVIRSVPEPFDGEQ